MRELVVGERDAGQRLSRYLERYLPLAPKNFIFKMLRKKNIVLNGGKAAGSEVLAAGDAVRLWLAEETIEKFAAGQGQEESAYPVTDLEILYEDRHVILVNKPAGMLSQRAVPSDVSLCEYLIGYLLASGQITRAELQTVKPSVCNRLDRNTSGIVCCGKTSRGLAALSELLRSRQAGKFYEAWVMGAFPSPARLEGSILKDEKTNRSRILTPEAWSALPEETRRRAKPVCSLITPLEERTVRGRRMTLVQVELITGRSHQIRVQLAAAGHTLVGDVKYAGREEAAFFEGELRQTTQLLHCARMEFPALRGVLAPLSGRTITAARSWRL